MVDRRMVLPILKEEAERGGYTMEQFRAKDATMRIRRLRQYAMWRARNETGRSWREIARHLDRDHTTAYHAYRVIENLPPDERGLIIEPKKKRVQPRRYLGRPCKNGHGGVRYYHSDRCVECNAAKHKRNKDRKRRFSAEAAE